MSFCGILDFRCMLRVPKGTVTVIAKIKKKTIVLFLPFVVCPDGVFEERLFKLKEWPHFLDGSSTANCRALPAISMFIYSLGRCLPSLFAQSLVCM
uniref:Uncharacterized protein n=1 Tax=Rhipicephalus appendiculatus TaxID=34631 RepID=A0A131YEF6_RHIAP